MPGKRVQFDQVTWNALDLLANAADKAARAEAEAVIRRWNDQLAIGRGILWSPTIRAALLADTPWLDVFRPGCGTGRANRPPDHRSPPARVGRHAGARAALLVVSGFGACAEASAEIASSRPVCLTGPIQQ
jgi:hypothetical protein